MYMIVIIPLSFLFSFALFQTQLYKNAPHATRQSALAAFILIFFFIAVSTEFLNLFGLITAPFVTGSWIVFSAMLAYLYFQLNKGKTDTLRSVVNQAVRNGWQFFLGTGLLTQLTLSSLLLCTFVVALVATPNNPDALSYHISRVVYWVQNASVEHYPSHIERSISFSPFSEYVHLHSFLLSGSERFMQLLQWFSLVGIVLVVSLLVVFFSKSKNALSLALCFAVTVPIVILESMTTQNDLVVSFFVIATAYYVFQYLKTPQPATLLLLSASIALGVLTKGIYPFYAAPFGLFFVIQLARKRKWKSIWVAGTCVLALTLLLNLPFWGRTYQLTGSPIGTLTQGNRNMSHTPKAILSSVSKQVCLQLGFISPGDRYNQFLTDRLGRLHQLMNFPLNEPGMGMPFKMTKLNFSEDYASNFLSFWLVVISVVIVFFRRLSKQVLLYYILSIGSFVTFCIFISYQIFGSRLHIPFFMLITPAIGIIYGTCASFIRKSLQLTLWFFALPFALLSTTHPLLSTKWFFTQVFPVVNKYIHMNVDPEKQSNLMHKSIIFNSANKILWGDEWSEIESLVAYVDSVNAQNIGYYFNERSYDYAFNYVLRKPGRRFEHIAVPNPSGLLESPDFHPDCIIAEIDRGPSFSYNGVIYNKKWFKRIRWIYLPQKNNG